MFKCKSCGGDLIFSIAAQDMECLFCGSHFPTTDYADDKAADEYKDPDSYETTVYTCTQCGGELTSPDNSAVAFCSFCGTEAVLEGRIEKLKRPEKIVPFQKTKDQCRQIYLDLAKDEPYAPKEFSDPAFLEKFRGIYIPYWDLNVGFQKNPALTIRESYDDSHYSYQNDYSVQTDLSGKLVRVPQDASAGFDDELAASILPFDQAKEEDFSPAYLAGFFADTADVAPEVYAEDAKRKAEDHVIEQVKDSFRESAEALISDDAASRNELFGGFLKEAKLRLYPVWFLTWRKGERLAYAIVNGETGQITAEVPIDIPRFLKTSGIIALITFLIMNIAGLVLTPDMTLAISAGCALMTQLLLRSEAEAIRARELHENDMGSLSGKEQEAMMEKRKKRRKRDLSSGSLGTMLVGIIVVLIAGIYVFGSGLMPIAVFLTLVLGLFHFFKTVPSLLAIKEKYLFFAALLPVAAECAAMVLALANAVEDWKYYAASILLLGSMALASFTMITQYNLLTTRSLPDFHGREGGNKDAGR